ncbi:MAG: hypothetical protein BWY43_00665 [candidate division WS2 bacterium ADurb.Bin280]|uniref:Uncharacterized protein n=1 Tax=candidate division WS2 bacterium ADurb.Bin280 TaxID=1852829 RepID=A0A1V5SC27_9BACT|nr:MAG: hypothetical protein BWY43_00665 [candidate division WS2 bacterium ADurb.Bin280]
MIKKTCRQCNTEFIIEDADLEFYKKISPTFDGKTFEIPAPSLCPRCLNIKRFAMRNIVNLYKRKCDLCGKDSVSMYSPDKKDIKVFCHDCWWSDKWSHADYAQDYDANKSFFEQIAELKKKVPQPALMHSGDENSDYINLANDNKNCYLVFLSGRNENVYYGYWAEDSKDCVDINMVAFSEFCYESSNLDKCYNLNWSVNCNSCRDCYFVENCTDCSDCILCSGLNHKSYCYKNNQLTKEEFEKIKDDFFDSLETDLEGLRNEFRQIIISTPKRFAQILRSENCFGDYIFDSKNCFDCFRVERSEDCRNCYEINYGKDMRNVSGFGLHSELIYESQNIGISSNNCAFISFAYQLVDSLYCEHCYYSADLFGCVGAKNHARYCVLNKQYSKEEYEKKVAEIIEGMRMIPLSQGSAGQEWGEFFPANFSSFGYNESIASTHYLLSREEAIKSGYNWQDADYDIETNGSPYEPLPIKSYEHNEEARKDLLSSFLICEVSGRPFKILPQELLFHIKQNLPLPRRHYLVRMKDRLNMINKDNLYHRQCMCEEQGHGHEGRCQNEFETTYAPDRPEKVYCESCYQKSVL